MSWTGYSSPEKLRARLDSFVRQLENGKLNVLKQIEFELLPTASLCEHAMSNGWGNEYNELASRFEKLQELMIQNNGTDQSSNTWRSFTSLYPSGTFCPGLTKEQQQKIPQDFPNDLRLVLNLSNGQNLSNPGVFEAKSGYSKVSKLKLLNLEQTLALKATLQNTADLDVFNTNMTPFAVDNLNSPDDVFCLEAETNRVWLLWVGISDPFLPADWQYAKTEYASSFNEFIVNQSRWLGASKPKPEGFAGPSQNPEQKKPYILFEQNSPNFKTKIELYFDKEGNFVMDGYDIGKGVNELLGDSDYEYQITVACKDVPLVYKLFNVSNNSSENLFEVIKTHYSKETGFSEFRSYLESNNIVHRFFS